MKKYFLFLIFFPLALFSFDTVSECDSALDSLRSERFRLLSLPVVVYRDRDDPKSNMSKRLRVVQINRVFSPYDKSCSFARWSKLNEQALAYRSAVSRVQDLDREIKLIEDRRLSLLKIKGSRAAVKVGEGCGVPRKQRGLR